MEKIGILTHPLEKNYGGIIQNWALQQMLRRMGHEAVTVNWRSDVPSWGEYFSLNTLRGMASWFYHLAKAPRVRFPKSPLWKDKDARGIRNFIKSNIRLTRVVYKPNVSRFVSRNFDVVIVGSDQVWRPLYINPIETMFLPVKKRGGQKKIAFSASFGTDQWEFTPQQTLNCRQLLKNFDAVSVREVSGMELCSEHLDRRDVVWTLDPTLMVDKEDYEALCSHLNHDSEGHVFEYILDNNGEIETFCKETEIELGLKRKSLGVDTRVGIENTIEDWLASFRDARYVVTDSFHGVVFCLIFHKPFALFYNPYRGNARFDSLMQLFPAIKDCIVKDGKLPENDIDWEAIDATIASHRATTRDFLKNALA